jgi:pimeloyl-ACP methyl ester carboxylesterase
MKHSFKINTLTLAALVMLPYATPAYAKPKDVPSLVSVSLPGGGGIVDIQIDNFKNPNKNAGNKTLLAVHGLAHTGATFEPLAHELFKKTGSDKIDRVLALNFPGRNGSGLPSNKQFGDLTIEDYTEVLLGVLDQLPKQIKIESLVGHSMGGLIVQTAQNSLRSAGTSLQKEYGIKNVYLLAPSIPNPLPWLFADSVADSRIPAILTFLKSSDPILGDYLQLLSRRPAIQAQLLGVWLSIFFTNSLGEFAPGTPFTTALELNYVSNEALIMIQQLLGFNLESGSNGFARPSVNPGIFNKSVQKCFRIVAFSEDLGVPGDIILQEYQDLDTFLAGNAQSKNVVFIEASDAVHDMLIANPAEVAKTITSCDRPRPRSVVRPF